MHLNPLNVLKKCLFAVAVALLVPVFAYLALYAYLRFDPVGFEFNIHRPVIKWRTERIVRRLRGDNPSWIGDISFETIKQISLDEYRYTDESRDQGKGVLSLLSFFSLYGVTIEGNIKDISALEGLGLYSVNLINTNVSDISALADMPLSAIAFRDSPVSDLSPLRGKKIWLICLDGTKVVDLSPVLDSPHGYPIVISLSGTDVSDISLLKSFDLDAVYLHSTKIKDLSSLYGKTIKSGSVDLSVVDGSAFFDNIKLDAAHGDFWFYCLPTDDFSKLSAETALNLSFSGTDFKDLSIIKHLDINSLDISHTKVDDLSPLKGKTIYNIRTLGTNYTLATEEYLLRKYNIKCSLVNDGEW